MYITEGNKKYKIEDGRVVAAFDATDEAEASPVSEKFDFGDRVSYREKAGHIISIVPSVYGETIGVRFDDGAFDEFDTTQLTKLEAEKQIFASDIDEFVHEYEEYQKLPDNTLEEVEVKSHLARSLNLRAKSLITDAKLGLTDRVKLDTIVTATFVDHADLEESVLHLRVAENKSYLDSRPQYEMSKNFGGWGSLARTKTNEDISWLSTVADPEDDGLWETRLAELAKQAIAQLSREQLNDTEFMGEVSGYQLANIPTEKHARFSTYLSNARELKLSEPVVTPKQAKAEEDLSGVEDEALFL